MSLDSCLNRNVCLAPVARNTVGTGRVGTVFCTMQEFATAFGSPHEDASASSDGKVTAVWYFDTPFGPARVHDYWSNPPGVLSLGGSWRACTWVRFFLVSKGIMAVRGVVRSLEEVAHAVAGL